MGFGVLDVLAPLRLDALGASGLAIGATFFVAAGFEAIISPLAGRIADRRGAAYLIRAEPPGGGRWRSSCSSSRTPRAPLAVAVVLAAAALGLLWAPAGSVLSRGADRIGLRAGLRLRAVQPGLGAAASRSARGPAAAWPRSPATRCPTSRSPPLFG